MVNRTVAALVVLVGVACKPSSADPPTVAPQAQPARPASSLSNEPWVVAILPHGSVSAPGQMSGNWWRGTTELRSWTETQRYGVANGKRFVASDVPAAGIDDVVEGDGGLAFLTYGGFVYRSDTFGSALTPVGDGAQRFESIAASGDRIYACGRDGSMAQAKLDGSSGFVASRTRCKQIVARPHDLFIIDQGGTLRRSVDAGKTFGRSSLGRKQIKRISYVPGSLSVTTADGTVTLDERGRVVTRPARDSETTSEAEFDRQEQWQQRADEALYARYEKIESAIFSLRSRDGACFGERGVPFGCDGQALPKLEAGACAYMVAAGSLQAVCIASRDEVTQMELHRLTAGQWKQLARWETNVSAYDYEDGDLWTPIFGDEGAVVTAGGCSVDDAPGQDPQTVLCWFDGQRVFTVPLGDDMRNDGRGMQIASTPVGLSGSWLLLADEWRSAPSHRLIDLEQGGRGIDLDYSRHGKLTRQPRFIDGRVVAVVVADAGGVVVIDEPRGRREVRRLPRGAKDADFADAKHGLAVGDNAAAVWTTSDLGARWVRLAVPVRGDATKVRLDEVSCGTAGCFAQPVLWMDPGVLAATGYKSPTIVAPRRSRRRTRGQSPKP